MCGCGGGGEVRTWRRDCCDSWSDACISVITKKKTSPTSVTTVWFWTPAHGPLAWLIRFNSSIYELGFHPRHNPPLELKLFKMTEIFQLKRAQASSFPSCVMVRSASPGRAASTGPLSHTHIAACLLSHCWHARPSCMYCSTSHSMVRFLRSSSCIRLMRSYTRAPEREQRRAEMRVKYDPGHWTW